MDSSHPTRCGVLKEHSDFVIALKENYIQPIRWELVAKFLES